MAEGLVMERRRCRLSECESLNLFIASPNGVGRLFAVLASSIVMPVFPASRDCAKGGPTLDC